MCAYMCGFAHDISQQGAFADGSENTERGHKQHNRAGCDQQRRGRHKAVVEELTEIAKNRLDRAANGDHQQRCVLD